MNCGSITSKKHLADMQGVFVFCVIERFLLSLEMVFLMH